MTEDRLSYLFLKYLENTCSQQEIEEFFAYIRRAKTDDQLRGLIKKVYGEIKLSHPSFTFVDEAGKLVFTEPVPEYPASGIKRAGRGTFAITVALAVGVVIVSGIIWVSNKLNSDNNKIAEIKTLTKKFTERKEQKYLLLPDSTQVWLNTASSLQFPDEFKSEKREVYLSGEAFFDVKHADQIPFLIHTGTVTTTVMGTAFNIKAYEDQQSIIVSVSRGKVKVSKDNRLLAILTKGKEIKIDKTSEGILQKEVSDEKIAGWQRGDLIYDEVPLEDIIRDLRNVFNTSIHIEDSAVGKLIITTSFSRDIGAKQALEILARLTNREIEERRGSLIFK
jgi:ferric-dicitrate binding protein FerR (iron transport regulator)